MNEVIKALYGDKALRDCDPIAEAKSCMVSALKAARERRELKPEDVDKACGLGADMPSCATYESSPSCIDSWVFTTVANFLNVRADEALEVRPRLSRVDALAAVVRHMRASSPALGPGAALPNETPEPELAANKISLEEMAPLYATVEVLNALCG